jgi:hypothetical protein
VSDIDLLRHELGHCSATLTAGAVSVAIRNHAEDGFETVPTWASGADALYGSLFGIAGGLALCDGVDTASDEEMFRLLSGPDRLIDSVREIVRPAVDGVPEEELLEMLSTLGAGGEVRSTNPPNQLCRRGWSGIMGRAVLGRSYSVVPFVVAAARPSRFPCVGGKRLSHDEVRPVVDGNRPS